MPINHTHHQSHTHHTPQMCIYACIWAWMCAIEALLTQERAELGSGQMVCWSPPWNETVTLEQWILSSVEELGPPVEVSFPLGLWAEYCLRTTAWLNNLEQVTHTWCLGLMWLLGMKTSTLSSWWMHRAASPESLLSQPGTLSFPGFYEANR